MNPSEFSKSASGRLIQTDSGYWAFIPAPLHPEVQWSPKLVTLLSEAERALAQLAEVGQSFSPTRISVKPFVRQEAVISSRIEGTRTSLRELYSYEAGHLSFLEADTDAQEVQNYVQAMEYGLERLETLPVSLRFIRELHEKLMRGVRGDIWTPGEFRRNQNWIGASGSTIETARYVPPPVEEMHTCLHELEDFIHAPSDLPLLIRLGMIHVQFEAIHPFLDGNGRVGRLLISLLLCAWDLLPQPFLHLSVFIEAHRSEYYKYLLAVSQKGDWEAWLSFFLTGIREQSLEAKARVKELVNLRESYSQQLEKERTSERLMQAIDFIMDQPVLSVRQLEAGLNLSNYLSAQRLVAKLEKYDILQEVTGQARNRIYQADGILRAILEPIDAPNNAF
ncbi:MAG: Fic family protein [Anaerolineales bacterium]|nr:Fic family protein [Anaerolineales bacterium]